MDEYLTFTANRQIQSQEVWLYIVTVTVGPQYFLTIWMLLVQRVVVFTDTIAAVFLFQTAY